MTQSDKLRFEVGEGFNILSPSEIKRNEEKFEKELREQKEDYGYSGDGPYYDAIYEWSHYIYHKYFKKPEEFINAIVAHDDWNTFGWALKVIKDNSEIYKYAKIYLEKYLASQDLDEEDINLILEDTSLPS